MIPRALAAWGDLRGAMRAEREDGPTDGRLLGFLITALLINWISAIPLRLKDPVDDLNAAIGMGFVATVFMAPLVFYALSVAMTWSGRAFGGKAGYFDTRLALFWGFLVAMPVIVLANVAENLLGGHLIIRAASGLGMVYVLGTCMAEINGHAAFWRGAAQVLLPSAVLLALSALVSLL